MARWTPRHTEVAEYLVVRGMTYGQIASILQVSVNTISYALSGTHQRMRRDYQIQLIHNCQTDLNEIGIPLDEAITAYDRY